MRRLAWFALLSVLAAGEVQARSTKITGTVYTEKAVAAVALRVWAAGPALVADPALAGAPLVELATVPGKPFTLEVPEPGPPFRVEAAAAGHVAAAFDVVLAEQAALPVLWLPAGREIEVQVEGAGEAEARLHGGLVGPGAASPGSGRWVPAVPHTRASAAGSAGVVVPRTDYSIALLAVTADGRFGSQHAMAPLPARLTVRVTSRPVIVGVVDERDHPVAGVAVAASGCPAGLAARTGEDGAATVQAPAEGNWAAVAVGDGIAGRTAVRSAPAAPVRVVVRPVEPLRVVGAGAAVGRDVLAYPSWLPAALGGDVPRILKGGAGEIPFLLPGGRLLLSGPGVASEAMAVDAAAPAVAPRLRAAVGAQGRVVDGNGAGVAGVPVWSWEIPGVTGYPRRSRAAWRPDLLMRPLLPLAVSGPDGRFGASGLAPGLQRFTAIKAGLPPADSDPVDAAPGAVVPVTLTLAQGAWLSLLVRDPGGVPIAGATVRAWPVPAWQRDQGAFSRRMAGRMVEPAAEVASDGEGRVRLAPLATGAVALELKAPGYVRRTLDATVAREGTDLGVQVLEPGVEVLGRVVDEAGNGVGELDVLEEDMPGIAFGEPVAKSDAGGQFTIPDQPHGGELRLMARGEGWVPVATVAVAVPPEAPLELRVRRARKLAGRVVDERDGEPVAGARVWVSKEVRRASGMSMASVGGGESGEDGTFEVGDLGAGGYVVGVQAAGFARAEVEVTLPEDEAPRPVTVVLRRGLAIAGRVEESNGTPAAGVYVELEPASRSQGSAGGRISRDAERTDPEGAFRFDGLEPGQYQLGAGDDEGAGASEVVEAGAAEPVVLRLQPPGSLLCRVVDGDGAPVAGADLRVYPMGGAVSGPLRAASDAGGTATFAALAAQRYRVMATAKGLAPANQDVTVTGGRPAEVTVSLERGGTVTGHVVGLTPEQTARVEVSTRGGSSRVAGDGSFRLDGVAVGVGQVYAWLHPEGRQRIVAFELTDADSPVSVEIDFAGGATITGSVRRGGRPAEGAAIECTRRGRPEGSTVADAAGAYALKGIDPGEVDLTVSDDTGRSLAVRRVTVAGATRVDFDVPGGELSGAVVDVETRAEVPLADVVIRAAGGPPFERQARCGDDGRFLIGELADGDYTVTATAAGYAPAEAAVHLAMGRAADVTLALAAEQRLDLVVIEADGAAADSVLIVPAANGRVLDGVWARCDARGRAVVTALPPGTYTALLMSRGAALARLVVPSAGGRVALAPAGRLVVTAPAGAAAPWRVRVVADGGVALPILFWLNPDRGEWVTVHGQPFALRVPAGAYAVQVVDPAGTSDEHRVQVPADGDAVVRLGE